MEVWKDVKGFEGEYQVSNLGRVLSLSRILGYNHSKTNERHYRKTKELFSAINECKGYNIVGLRNKKYRVCRLVAIAFLDNPQNKPCVNHIDGNKKNDNVNNLEWVTYKENMEHSVKNNLHKPAKGKNHFLAKKVLCTKTNLVFDTIKDACEYYNLENSVVSRKLRNIYTNNTSLILI